MERPTNIVGLVVHLARVRWQGLSPIGRTAVVGGMIALGALGARAAMCGACSHSCAYSQRAEAAAIEAADESPCHAGR